jgi:hypothetical protein
MRVRKASFRYISAAALVGIAIFLSAASAHASIATQTTDALDSHPIGGSGLEAAITSILESYRGHPGTIAKGVLDAVTAANEEQMIAIGRAMAAYARALAKIDPAGDGAVKAAVIDTRNPVLQKSFKSARGHRKPGLAIPSGNDGGGLDTTSPS